MGSGFPSRKVWGRLGAWLAARRKTPHSLEMIGFHTPKLPPPLNLDLAELSGGGSCPTQFYGKTHDGRDVYVRYRGGQLRVQVAARIGDNVHDAAPLVDIGLGPMADGDIRLSDFCRWFGVTINGRVPPETTGRARHVTDLSGETTYFEVYLAKVAHPAATEIVRVCMTYVPDAILVQPVSDDQHRILRFEKVAPDQISAFTASLVTGVRDTEELGPDPAKGMSLRQGQLHLQFVYTRWKYPGVLSDSLQAFARFPTTDTATRTQLERLIDPINAFFP